MKILALASRLLLAALALAPLHHHAHAATGAVSISGLKFELIDLDTGDGIAPSLTWTTPYANLYASAKTGSEIIWMGADAWDFDIPTELPTGNLAIHDEWLPAREVRSGGTTSKVGPDGIGVSFTTAAAGGYGSGSVQASTSFVLTPNTTLKVSGVFDLSVAGPASTGVKTPQGASPDYATLFAQGMAYASVGLNPLEGGTVNTVASGENVSVDEQNYTPSTNEGLSTLAYSEAITGRAFTLNLVNDAPDVLKGQFFAMVATSGLQGTAAAVPEASSLGLALAGLVAMGALRRRRASV